MAEEDTRETFVAPRGPALGQPSADTMARLQAAVGRAPAARELPQQETVPQARMEETEVEKPRFGINSLINRMTGANAEASAAPARPARQQPQLKAEPVSESPEREEDDQIEIPAFLRRQAN
jgi:cell division protein FtsZ